MHVKRRSHSFDQSREAQILHNDGVDPRPQPRDQRRRWRRIGVDHLVEDGDGILGPERLASSQQHVGHGRQREGA